MKRKYLYLILMVALMSFKLFGKHKEKKLVPHTEPTTHYTYLVSVWVEVDDEGDGGSRGGGNGGNGNGNGGGGGSGNPSGSGGSGSDEAAKKAEEERRAEEERKAAEIAAAKAKAKKTEDELDAVSKKYGEVNTPLLKTESLINAKNKEIAELLEKKATQTEIRKLEIDREILEVYRQSQKIEVDKVYKVLEEKSDKMIEAYKELGQVYDKYNYTGDPVQISTGDFSLEVTDFTAQDFLEKFIVKRSLSNPGITESFGRGWTCSLDSRIVRCCAPLDCDPRGEIAETKVAINNYLEKVREVNAMFEADLINRGVDEEQVQEVLETYQILDDLDQYYNGLSNVYNQFSSMNRLVTYGRYSDPMNYDGHEGIIKYLDENGREFVLLYSGNGRWNTPGQISGKRFYIQGLGQNGNNSSSEAADGGYIVFYSDGRRKVYSNYGILKMESDLNGNQVAYQNQNGRINSITLKTGEMLSISRNSNGFITSVSGPVSGNCTFAYKGSQLVEVVNTEGIKTAYSYDDENYLEKIIKPEGVSVTLGYEYNAEMGKKVCVSVARENGTEESFAYYPSLKKTVHTDYDKRQESYFYDDSGNTVLINDSFGNVIEIIPYENEMIKSVKENGLTRTFVYDEQLQPVNIYNDDGFVEKLSYNSYGQLSSYSDFDGFSVTYDYDDKGNVRGIYQGKNLFAQYEYYSNGLVRKEETGGFTVDYEYNKYGSITKKITSIEGYKSRVQDFEYDKVNRLVKVSDSQDGEISFSYDSDNNKITETYGKRKRIERFFDEYKREFKTISTDLKTNEKYIREQVFDGNGNVLKVFVNEQLVQENEYSETGILKSVTKDGVKNSYRYTKKGYLDEIWEDENKLVCKYLYEVAGGKNIVKITNEFGFTTTRTFDKYGYLVNEVDPDGYSISTVYSPAGRKNTVRDSENNLLSFSYREDGSYSVLQQKNGLESKYEYNRDSKLTSLRDFGGLQYYRDYDRAGYLTSERGPGYEIKYEYFLPGRVKSYSLTDYYGMKCQSFNYDLDDENSTITVLRDNQLYQRQRLDAWNRPVEVLDGNGKRWIYYDSFNNPVRILFENGYEVSLSDKNSGNAAAAIVTAVMDPAKNQLTSVDVFSSGETVSYDEYGRTSLIENNKTGSRRIVRNSSNSFSVRDENGYEHFYEYNSEGLLSYEKNPFGKSASYEYDSIHRIIRSSDFSGRVKNYFYDDEKMIQRMTDEKGNSTVIGRNPLGEITSIKSAYCDQNYEYNDFGDMVYYSDNLNGVQIEYFYDNFGRVVEKKSGDFDLVYEYDSCGRVSRILDRVKDAWVACAYNGNGSEAERTFSNGYRIVFEYETSGLVKNCICKDALGLVVYAEYITRDEKGRVTCVKKQNGQESNYEYDSRGRLVKSSLPYSPELGDFYLREAEECGIYVKNEAFVLNKGQWTSSYEYTKNGSLAEVTNPYGTILYDYDGMNRLVAKYGKNSRENGMTFDWDDNGNILSIKSKLYVTEFEYADGDRASRVLYRDLVNGGSRILEFTYDPLGRRVSERSGQGESRIYVYDGLSLNLIQSLTKMENNRFVSDFGQSYSGAYSGDSLLEKYRWIDDSGYSAGEDYRVVDFENYSAFNDVKSMSVKTESIMQREVVEENRPYSVITLNGIASMLLYSDYGYDESVKVEYLLPDYRKSVSAVCDSSSNLKFENFYDDWGNELSSGKNFSYSCSSSKYTAACQFLNLGYRDYCPMMKCFTSLDPVRDGENWFAYCCGDPVNYWDVAGWYVFSQTPYFDMTYYYKMILGNGYGDYKLDKDGKAYWEYDKNGYIKSADYIDKSGCYIISLANEAKSIETKNPGRITDKRFTNPMWINQCKKLFALHSGNIILKDAMDAIYGKNTWNRFTKNENGLPAIKAKFEKYKILRNEYSFKEVFDLTSIQSNVPNHMVGVNDFFNGEGFLNENSDIVRSSANDTRRIVREGHLDAYSLHNLKELIVVAVNPKCGI